VGAGFTAGAGFTGGAAGAVFTAGVGFTGGAAGFSPRSSARYSKGFRDSLIKYSLSTAD
jgi:hypothetical protein